MHYGKTFILSTLFLTLVAVFSSCGHSTLGRLVGSDRDEHGCIGSAGYTWSYALHDCVRLWEAGTRFDAGPEQVYLIFSPDSTLAEVFPSSGGSIICKRSKQNPNFWRQRKGHAQVYIKNNVLCVEVNDFTYTQKQ